MFPANNDEYAGATNAIGFIAHPDNDDELDRSYDGVLFGFTRARTNP